MAWGVSSADPDLEHLSHSPRPDESGHGEPPLRSPGIFQPTVLEVLDAIGESQGQQELHLRRQPQLAETVFPGQVLHRTPVHVGREILETNTLERLLVGLVTVVSQEGATAP